MSRVQPAIASLENLESLKVNEIKELLEVIKADYCGDFKEELLQLAASMEADGRSAVTAAAAGLSRQLVRFEDEVCRVSKLYAFDGSFGESGLVAGADEVGRGPLAGPIVAASVILDRKSLESRDIILGINDSKRLSPHLREELSEIIKSRALCFNIHQCSSKDIDKKGISWCNNEVLKRAAEDLSLKPKLVLSDGYPVKGIRIRNEFVIKGDSKSASIACASILAKVYRDGLMKEYGALYPEYGFESNSGYGSREHIEAIRKCGPTEIHRMSFLSNIIGD
jgi:ribonuclease HII